MRTRGIIIAAAVLATAVSSLFGAGPAQSAPTWAPAASAAIHPGVMMFTDGAQCTANFVYTDAGSTYLGYAAHCAGTGAATETDGCLAASLPLGTPVEIDGATRPGTLAYSSWLTMQAGGETDPDTCAYNDLALVRLDPADVARTNPSIPHWGGPVGLNTAGNPALASVYSYGNSSLRQGIALLSPKTGVSLGTTGGGWTHPVYTVSPGIPGDSGSAFLDAGGRATGVLSTLAIAPTPLSNNVSDLRLALDYMHGHGGPQATLALGTEPFRPGQLPLGGLGL
jgi:hypothetical protein